ncbi:MAG TPA: putative lipid II flippase FtsW [Mycobacteriales bacterium]|jgi:cell division protein FtsW
MTAGVSSRTAIRRRLAFLDRPLTSLHLILVTTGLLTVIGLVMVLSASSVDSYAATGSAFDVFKKQLMWVAIGAPIFWLGIRLSPKAYRRLAYPALALSFVALLAVLVPGVGNLVSGSRRWIELGPLQLQPSEPAKLALALWGADLLVRKEKLLDQWRHLLIPIVPVAIAACALVMLEPDLGTTICVVLVLFGLLWTVGAPGRLFVLLASTTIGAVVVLIMIEPYRMTRFTSFLNPFKDQSDKGYQAAEGLYSLSSGGWFGVGLGQSRFKWGLLPNAHTDYIFAIVGEELGLVGSLLVLALFAVLAYAGLRIARRATDPFVRLASAAVTVWLVGQALINIGYVTGLLPVTGIPLPLISFGGTSLIVTLFALGMLASFARHEPAAAAALRARGPSRMARILWLPAPAEPRPKSARITRIRRPPERATGPAPRGRGSGRAGTVLPATGTDGRRTR